MTKQQVRWARDHDWYLGTMSRDGQIIIFVKHDYIPFIELEFTDFNELKIWAGY